MKKQPKRNLSVRIDLETYEKLCQISRKEYRSVSGLVFFWIRRCIREYEQIQSQKDYEISL